MVQLKIVLFALLPGICAAQSLTSCKTIFIQPMPESLDRFLAHQLSKKRAIEVVATKEQADCVASYGREADRIWERLVGSGLVMSKVSAGDTAAGALPSYFNGFGYSTSAAIEIVHRESSFLVWSDSKTDSWSLTGGPKTLATRLVKELISEYKAEQKYSNRPHGSPF